MSKINKSKVLELVSFYGADLKRWPSTQRQAGQIWLDKNPALAQEILADAIILEQALNTISAPASNTILLQARILREVTHTAQEGIPYEIAANDTAPTLQALTVFSAWKAVAATLLLTTGMGFGIGQVAAADTSYVSAEALLSISMQSGYAETDLYGDGV